MAIAMVARSKTARWRVSRALSPWLIVGFLSAGLSQLDEPPSTSWWTSSVAAASACTVVLGAYIFLRHGGPRITAAGIFGFATALFVGFAGIYTLTSFRPGEHVPGLLPAVLSAYVILACAYGVWWSDDTDLRATRGQASVIDSAIPRWGFRVGALLLAPTLTLAVSGHGSSRLNEFAFTGAILLTTGMFLKPARGRILSPLLVSLLLMGVFAKYVFNGFGRLELGSFGLALAFTACAQFRGYQVKLGILAGTAPVLLYLAQQRVHFTAGLNQNQLPNVTGFESVVGPLNDFARLLDMNHRGTLGLHWLSTFWASAVSLVPRSVWPSKPDGFGAVLGNMLRPELRGSNFSELALFNGEMIYAFGILGLALMAPLVGIGVRRLDRWLVPFWAKAITSRQGLVMLVWVTILIAGLPDLVWGGTFTYVSRAATRSLPLIVLLLLTSTRPRDRRTGSLRSNVLPVVADTGVRTSVASDGGRPTN